MQENEFYVWDKIRSTLLNGCSLDEDVGTFLNICLEISLSKGILGLRCWEKFPKSYDFCWKASLVACEPICYIVMRLNILQEIAHSSLSTVGTNKYLKNNIWIIFQLSDILGWLWNKFVAISVEKENSLTNLWLTSPEHATLKIIKTNILQ